MPLSFLLDEHISPQVAARIVAKRREIPVLTLLGWEGGIHLGESDELVLQAAFEQRLTLVTYDQKTIAPLLRTWAEQEQSHGGVIFVDQRTLYPSDFGGLVRALCRLWDSEYKAVWTNRVVYLKR